jgi:hypothetical protein
MRSRKRFRVGTLSPEVDGLAGPLPRLLELGLLEGVFSVSQIWKIRIVRI